MKAQTACIFLHRLLMARQQHITTNDFTLTTGQRLNQLNIGLDNMNAQINTMNRNKLHWTFSPFSKNAALLCAGLIISGAILSCNTKGIHMIENQSGSEEDADLLLVVDCLLPGQIKRLGRGATYVTPRRPAKLTAKECQDRGGEYTAYQEANTASALKVWLPAAQEGDEVAQTYVGEIYEKGRGIEPDYATAAAW